MATALGHPASARETRGAMRASSFTQRPLGTSVVLRAFALALVLGSAAAFLVALSINGSAPIFATAVLVGLAAITAHREAVFADETALSGTIVVICACVVGLGDTSALAPILCALAGVLHLDHVRNPRLLKLAVNIGATVVPAFAATLVFRRVSGSPEMVCIGIVMAVATYWVANNALVGFALGLANGRVREHTAHLIRSDTVMLVFGLGGAVCGLVMTEVGTWTGIATLVALLVALDVFVISVPAGLSHLRSAWAIVVARGVAGGVAGAVGAVVTRAVAISVAGALAGLAAGLTAGIAVVVVIVGIRIATTHRGVDPALVAGLAVAELAFPAIGAVSGVVTAVAGLDVGLVCASVLVVAGSVVVAVRRRAAERTHRPAPDDDTLMVAVMNALLDGLPNPSPEPGDPRTSHR
jgi:hypothetical protein